VPLNTLVVLMLENRSFDHLLGFMQSPSCQIDGLTGTEVNYLDPVARTGDVLVSDDAAYVPDVDPSPGHEFGNVITQIYGAYPPPASPIELNLGFVKDYSNIAGVAKASSPMRCFSPARLPVITTLAREFAVCDHWFSSLPGPTWPNRFFAHCATSGGSIDGAIDRVYTMGTLYQNLTARGINWRIYYHDIAQSLALVHQRQFLWTKYGRFEQSFARDCREGRLPQYSFIEPRYFNEGLLRANDQHPIHGVIGGELLIADIYEALRASPQWDESMLIITWDEHGGFYDHVEPKAATPPDDQTEFFNFETYGVRVPAVVASPLIARGTIDHAIYDHSSIPATAKAIFNLPAFLTRRDAAANTLQHLCATAPCRPDAPLRLARPNSQAIAQSSIAEPEVTSMNDLQVELLALARSLGGLSATPGPLSAVQNISQGAAAREIRENLARFTP